MNRQNIGQFYPTKDGHMAQLVWIEDGKEEGTHLFVHYETVNGKPEYVGVIWHYGDGRAAIDNIGRAHYNFDLI